MARSRRATLALLARLPDAALRRPRTQGAWSIQEVLGHIAAWEAEGARRLALLARGRGNRIVWYDTAAEMDAFNAAAVRGWHRLARPAALRRLAAARVRLVAALGRVPPPRLADPAAALPVTVWLREFAWTHETAHRRALAAWRRAHRAEWAEAPAPRRPRASAAPARAGARGRARTASPGPGGR
jgi:hypothetical protein